MAFNHNDFRAAFSKKESQSLSASPAYFEAYFESAPKCLGPSVLKPDVYMKIDNTLRNIKFRATSADLPARQLVSLQRAFNGPHKLVPYSTIYTSSIIEFIETSEFDIRIFFDTWHDLIEGNQRNFSTEYYDNLIAPTFIIKSYNKGGKAVATWTLYNVFPISVNPTQMNWSSQSANVTTSVELSFYRWKYESLT